jgi:hypothetical protein
MNSQKAPRGRSWIPHGHQGPAPPRRLIWIDTTRGLALSTGGPAPHAGRLLGADRAGFPGAWTRKGPPWPGPRFAAVPGTGFQCAPQPPQTKPDQRK